MDKREQFTQILKIQNRFSCIKKENLTVKKKFHSQYAIYSNIANKYVQQVLTLNTHKYPVIK